MEINKKKKSLVFVFIISIIFWKWPHPRFSELTAQVKWNVGISHQRSLSQIFK